MERKVGPEFYNDFCSVYDALPDEQKRAIIETSSLGFTMGTESPISPSMPLKGDQVPVLGSSSQGPELSPDPTGGSMSSNTPLSVRANRQSNLGAGIETPDNVVPEKTANIKPGSLPHRIPWEGRIAKEIPLLILPVPRCGLPFGFEAASQLSMGGHWLVPGVTLMKRTRYE
jgi:hypothetical protein